MPFPDRSAHRSSRENAPGWGPSIAILISHLCLVERVFDVLCIALLSLNTVLENRTLRKLRVMRGG